MSFETANAFIASFIQDFISRGEEENESLIDCWNTKSSEFKKLFKKIKGKKDKNAPKKNSSAYIYFCNDKRSEIKVLHPDLKNNEILKELGLLWKKFKDEKPNEVKKYEKEAADDKERYQEEIKNYVPSEELENEPKEKKRKKKATGEPKKGKSAYLFFCADERIILKEEMPNLQPKEVLVELGARWKVLKNTNQKDVEQYEKMAAEDKERYNQDMKNYVPVDVDDKKKKPKAKKVDGQPKKGKSAYIFFCADERPIIKEEKPELSGKEVLVELGARWKKLSDEEKEKYNEIAAEDKKRYEEEIKNYVPVEEEPIKEKKKTAPKKKQQRKEPEPEPEPEQDDDEDDENTNEEIIKEIINNFEGDTITKKAIKDELKKRGIEISKDDLNEIISKFYDN